MYADERNSIFETKEHLITRAISRHHVLLRSCHLSKEDVYQELAISLLKAIERYDSRRCPNMDAYLRLQLRYALWGLIDCGKRFGIPCAPKKGFSVLSLQSLDQYGNEREVAEDNDFTNREWIKKEADRLPADQRCVVDKLLSGQRLSCNNKVLKAVRKRFRISSVHGLATCAG